MDRTYVECYESFRFSRKCTPNMCCSMKSTRSQNKYVLSEFYDNDNCSYFFRMDAKFEGKLKKNHFMVFCVVLSFVIFIEAGTAFLQKQRLLSTSLSLQQLSNAPCNDHKNTKNRSIAHRIDSLDWKISINGSVGFYHIDCMHTISFCPIGIVLKSTSFAMSFSPQQNISCSMH